MSAPVSHTPLSFLFFLHLSFSPNFSSLKPPDLIFLYSHTFLIIHILCMFSIHRPFFSFLLPQICRLILFPSLSLCLSYRLVAYHLTPALPYPTSLIPSVSVFSSTMFLPVQSGHSLYYLTFCSLCGVVNFSVELLFFYFFF